MIDEPKILFKACHSVMALLLIVTTLIDFCLSGCHECKHWSSSCSVYVERKPVKLYTYNMMIIIMMTSYH